MASSPAAPLSLSRRAILVVGAVVVLLSGIGQLNQLFRGEMKAPLDFAAFWAAGHLAISGDNPYSAVQLRDTQAAVGLTDLAVIAWNPPWTLTVLMPVGAVSFRSAYGLWLVSNFTLMGVGPFLLWRAYAGALRYLWAAFLISLAFVPTAFLIGGGQITAVVLFGLAGFAAAVRAERPLLAGAAIGLIATKPHLFVPLGVWLLIAGSRSRFGRHVLLGAIASVALMCVPPTVAAPNVWSDYLTALTGPPDARIRPLSEWKPPLIGWWVRQLIPGTPFSVQWGITAISAAIAAAWCIRSDVRLAPAESLVRLPWLVGVSLLVAPYGAWQYDLVLLLVPMLAVFASISLHPDRRTIAFGVVLLVSVNAVSLVMMMKGASSEWYVWVAPFLLIGMRILSVRETARQRGEL